MTEAGAHLQQLELLHSASRSRPARPRDPRADERPVARVAVDVPLPHLDRPFEYEVPARLASQCVPGARVRVRFAGQDRGGFVLARTDAAEHSGRLSPVRRVVSPEPVLTPHLAWLCRAVADRYAGTFSDVLRLAVPPRHARAEAALTARADEGKVADPAAVRHRAEQLYQQDQGPWALLPAGPAFLRRLRAGEAPWAAWRAAPAAERTQDWPAGLARAALATLAAGRGALVVVPDHRDVQRVSALLEELLGPDAVVRLTAAQGPQARYTAWLNVLRGHVRCVVGTRAAAFAPVHDLGLVAWWDDGDDLLAEPRAPYPHVREILALRAGHEHAALLTGAFSRSVHVQQWLERGAVRPIDPPRDRTRLPRVQVAGQSREVARHGAAARARLPASAWQAAHDGLARGPVLVQVPRRGYRTALRCAHCRAPARCAHCRGPLRQSERGGPVGCRWCGREESRFACPECGDRRLRATVVGDRRTAEELGRAFPGVPVVRSGAGEVVAEVPDRPALVIATPGAEPVADHGYAATLLLDGWSLLERPALDAAEEALRRWLNAAALTRSAADGGVVVLAGIGDDASRTPAVQALVRWAPAAQSERDLAERTELGLPPAAWMAAVTGTRRDVLQLAGTLPDEVERLGPIATPGDEQDAVRLLLRTGWPHSRQACAALARARSARSARKEPGTVQVRVDPEGWLL